MEEKWTDVLGYDGVYSASSLGRIYSSPRKGSKGGIRKQTVCASNGGYAIVKLCKDGQEKTELVSRIIWEAFNGPIPEGLEINHLNEVKTDNRLCNLELTDRKNNCNWGTRNERLVNNRSGYGAKKAIVQYIFSDNTKVAEFESIREASRTTGIQSSDISRCTRGLLKRTGDYTWGYKKEEAS